MYDNSKQPSTHRDNKIDPPDKVSGFTRSVPVLEDKQEYIRGSKNATISEDNEIEHKFNDSLSELCNDGGGLAQKDDLNEEDGRIIENLETNIVKERDNGSKIIEESVSKERTNNLVEDDSRKSSKIEEKEDEIGKDIRCQEAGESKSSIVLSDFKVPSVTKRKWNISIEIYKNVPLAYAPSLGCTVTCKKCFTPENIVVVDSFSFNCKKCKAGIEIKYTPSLEPDFIGLISFKGCKYNTFSPIQFNLVCSCSAQYFTPRPILKNLKTRCFNCSKEIELRVGKPRLQERSDYKLEKNKPLPNKGACKHYKRSFRWFRFPCCMKLYPCDECHDEEEDHAHLLASKMVCGLCSTEQSAKNECKCGMDIKKTTNHWEGGKGTRNKATMSKKDSKKYKK